jgi:hypothetical protein
MTLKSRVHEACIKNVGDRIRTLEAALLDLKAQLESDSKSSAGDKHETSRAMVHLEQEQLGKQVYETNLQLSALNSIPQHLESGIIQIGNLIECNEGYYYLSIGLGKLKIDELEVIAISPHSPLGRLFYGKKPMDELVFQKRTIRIYSIS